MYSWADQNISSKEQVIRLIIGWAIMFIVIFVWTEPMLALISLYPVNTALLRWDPFYALVGMLAPRHVHYHSHHKSRIIV